MTITRKIQLLLFSLVFSLITIFFSFNFSQISSSCCEDILNSTQLESYKTKALKGNSEALENVQLHYMQIADKRNLKEWLIIGANNDDQKSIEKLFSFVALGQLTLDEKQEKEWLLEKTTKTAMNGSAWAATLLGNEYLKGSFFPIEIETGKFWLRKASAMNEPTAIYSLAMLLIDDPTTSNDQREAIKLLEILYHISLPDSQYREFANSNLAKLVHQTQAVN